jgi:hypothetical protein
MEMPDAVIDEAMAILQGLNDQFNDNSDWDYWNGRVTTILNLMKANYPKKEEAQ